MAGPRSGARTPTYSQRDHDSDSDNRTDDDQERKKKDGMTNSNHEMAS